MLVHQIVPKLEIVEYKRRFLPNRFYKEETGVEYIKRELLIIDDFSEYYDQDGNVDPTKALVRTTDGWIEVAESFEDIKQLVSKTEFKGYGKNI